MTEPAEGELRFSTMGFADIPKLYRFFKQGLSPEQQNHFMPHYDAKGVAYIIYFMMCLQGKLSLVHYEKASLKDGDEMVGLLLLRDIKRDSAELGLAVATEHQGRGYGRVLMNRLARLAAEKKLKYLKLTHHSDNQKAHRLYLSMGFQVIGEKLTGRFGNKRKEIAMETKVEDLFNSSSSLQ